MNGKNAINSNFLNKLPPEHIIIGVLVLIILYLMFYKDIKILYNNSCNTSSKDHFTGNCPRGYRKGRNMNIENLHRQYNDLCMRELTRGSCGQNNIMISASDKRYCVLTV